MEEFLVCNANLMWGLTLTKARRLTEEEKTHCSEWFRKIGFVHVAESIKLDNVECNELFELLNNREPDGELKSFGGRMYIITQEQWDWLIKTENERQNEKEQKIKESKIKEYSETIKNCETAKKLYTAEEARAERIKYNNLYNEGGEGFVPHFYTVEEYEFAKNQLKKLMN